MLIAIINDKQNDKLTQLYLTKNSEGVKLSGFTVQNGKIITVDNSVFKIIDKLRLGERRRDLGRVDGYQIILDEDSGFKHFLRNGGENYELFFYANGTACAMHDCDQLYKNLRHSKKLELGYKGMAASIIVLTATLFGMLLDTIFLEYSGETVCLNDALSYVFSVTEKDKFNLDITTTQIEHYIYESNNIKNKKVKDFLFNEELFEDVLPCYVGTNMATVVRIRIKDIGIKTYNKIDQYVMSDTRGYYMYENSLHIRDYDEYNFDPSSLQAKTLGHEEIHLLQTYSCLPFLYEPSAEIIAHEYHMHSAKINDANYSYKTAVKYVQILMEIIGPKPIWENNFKPGSNLFEESIKPYFTEEEYQEFMSIMNLRPFDDADEIQQKTEGLEKLLSILYKNKYDSSMEDDPIITAILAGFAMNRAYFSKSLMQSENSYYQLPDVLSIEKARRLGIVRYIYEGQITHTEYMDSNFYADGIKSAQIRLTCDEDEVLENGLYLDEKDYLMHGYLIMRSGGYISANDALKMHLAYPFFSLYIDDVSDYKTMVDFGGCHVVSNIDYIEFNCDSSLDNIEFKTSYQFYLLPVDQKFIPQTSDDTLKKKMNVAKQGKICRGN